jgi:putative membrane protein insertion efficiency factor
MKSFREPGKSGFSALCFLAVLSIRLYQVLLSPVLRRRGVTCLHCPTCSEYGVLAFRKYPFLGACRLILGRYRDCHPFSGRPYIDYP